jgi:glutamyl-Q tRNA(Asp) synthetase
MEQNVARAVGDFVLKRADGIWAYQLAVVVDDAAQKVTHIVRGEDLLSSTARQQQLAGLLGYETPRVLHVPLVTDASGLKLSKQNHASAIDLANPLETLQKAWLALGFERLEAKNVSDFWTKAACVWGQRLSRANLHGIN